MTSLCTKTLCTWLIVGLILGGCPVLSRAAISESSSEGAAITVGLFITIVAVLFIIGFKSDMENVFTQQGGRADLVQAAGADLPAPACEVPVAGAGFGLRLTF